MMGLGTIVLLAAMGAVLYGIVISSALASDKHLLSHSWSQIDVLLKQRNDELPKLVAAARQHLGCEPPALQRVIEARNRAEAAQHRGDMQSLVAAESGIGLELGQFFRAVEACPDLRADEVFQRLARRISSLAFAIAECREFYNAAVHRNNQRLEGFPSLLVARLLGFAPFDPLELGPAQPPEMDLAALVRS